MEKIHKVKLTNDVLWVNYDIYCDFKIPENKRGFKLSDILGWLSSVEKDPSKELRKKVVDELDIVSPEVILSGSERILSWLEAKKDIVDKIEMSEEFELSMWYERRGGVFFRNISPDPPSKVDIREQLRFIVGDRYNEFILTTRIPTPLDFPDISRKIKNTVDRIVSDLIENRKINIDNVIVRDNRYTYGGIHQFSEYGAKIDKKNVSEAAEMVLGILDGTKEVLEELKGYYL